MCLEIGKVIVEYESRLPSPQNTKQSSSNCTSSSTTTQTTKFPLLKILRDSRDNALMYEAPLLLNLPSNEHSKRAQSGKDLALCNASTGYGQEVGDTHSGYDEGGAKQV